MTCQQIFIEVCTQQDVSWDLKQAIRVYMICVNIQLLVEVARFASSLSGKVATSHHCFALESFLSLQLSLWFLFPGCPGRNRVTNAWKQLPAAADLNRDISVHLYGWIDILFVLGVKHLVVCSDTWMFPASCSFRYFVVPKRGRQVVAFPSGRKTTSFLFPQFLLACVYIH
jgi:hypothetical protein